MKCSMDQTDRDHAVDGPVVSEGGRSPSALSTGQTTPGAKGGAAQGPLAPGQRWSASRKREVVLRLMRGESAELLSRELGLPLFKLEQWRQRAEAALEGALKEREGDPADGQLAAAMQRIGELTMENELLRAKKARRFSSRPWICTCCIGLLAANLEVCLPRPTLGYWFSPLWARNRSSSCYRWPRRANHTFQTGRGVAGQDGQNVDLIVPAYNLSGYHGLLLPPA